MAELNYTKGEWEIKLLNAYPDNRGNPIQEYCVVSDKETIAICPEILGNISRVVANAQLIASAPDMYETLKAIEPFITDTTLHVMVMEALNKAEGK